MSQEPSTVLIVDDDPAIRDSLESLLRSVGLSVRSFGTARDFLEADPIDVPACLILDVRLPGLSGLEFQRVLARSGAPIPVVFITAHGDVPMSVAAMKAGAIEFLTKPFRDQDLLDAVQKGIELDGRRRREAAVLAGLRERYDTMTAREREVFALVVEGRLNKQIAGELQLSEVTIKIHRAQVMQKLGARSLADLVRIADRLASATERQEPSDAIV